MNTNVRADCGAFLRVPSRAAVLAVCMVCLPAAYAAAQTPLPALPPSLRPTEAEPVQTITAAQIETRRTQAEADGSLDAATREQIIGLYDQAADWLKVAEASAAKSQALRKEAESVQTRLAEAKQRLDKLRSDTVALPGEMNLPELEQELARADRRLSDAKQAEAKAEAEASTRANRRRDVRNRLFSLPDQVDDLDRQLGTAPPRDESPLLTTARQSNLLARRMALKQEIAELEDQLAMYDAEDAVDLSRTVRDANTQEVAVAERLFLLLDGQVKRLRDTAAREVVRQAEEEVFRALPLLKAYAETNKKLAEETQHLTQLTNESDDELQQVRARLEEVQRLFTQARERVENVGPTRSVAAQLRKLKTSLPNVGRRRQSIRNRQLMIEDVQFQLLERNDERTLLARPEAVVEEILAEVSPQTNNAERERLRQAARGILDRKRDYLGGLLRIQEAYFDSLTTLDIAEQKLVDQTDDYVSYIDQHVLWIRSGRSLSEDYSPSVSNLWIFSPAQWQAVGRQLWDDVKTHYVLWTIAVALFTAIVFQRRRVRRAIREIGQQAARPSCTHFGLTARVVGWTMLLASAWPLLCWYVVWRLEPGTSPFVAAVATGLWVQACVYFVFEALRQICRRQGLAEAHFDWPPAVVGTLRTNLLWLIVFALPLVFLTTVLCTSDPEPGIGVLERISLMATCVVVSVSLGRVLRPTGGLLNAYLAHRRGGWIDRLCYVWYWGCVFAPLTLAALAYFGYVYTAQQLTIRLFFTVSLILLLVVIRAILLRLLMVYRRQLSIHQARERRAAALAALKAEAASGGLSHSQSIIAVEEVTDLAQSSTQTRRIVTTLTIAAVLVGGWCIWDDVVPTLRILDDWSVWSTVDKVTENVAEPGMEPRIETHDVLRVVTVADVLLALLVCIITMIAFRNLPGLMEMAVLQRLPLEHSVRYAITTLASYAIIMIGLGIAARGLGLRWSQIQWLATALTFGLAFGLQEMFANFIAGLIILFERPIRVGDVVTVEDITGVVSRVRIRATTITNWDRKEFVVPNKEFITGRLLNWTLSDQINRIVIAVGVAYGSPTATVRQILLKILHDHPLVLDEPEPIVSFESFGDSSLNFTIRVFLPTMENRLLVINDLHTAIHDALNEASITIPFPQRDLHIHTTEPSPAVEPRRPTGSSERTNLDT